MSEPIVVGIDVDGVLADLAEALIPLLQRDYGVDVPKEQVVRWDYYETVTGSVGAMLRLMDEAWINGPMPLEEPNLALSLSRLKAPTFHRLILSARTRASHPAVIQWLHEQRIPYDSLTLLGPGQAKLAYPVDILIDDRGSFVEGVQQYPHKFLFLRDQPWNRNISADLPRNVQRVASLEDAVYSILMKTDGKFLVGGGVESRETT